MRISLTDSFRSSYARLPVSVRPLADRQIALLASDSADPSLKIKRVEGKPDVWESAIQDDYRMTASVGDGVLFLRQIGRIRSGSNNL